MLLVQLLGLIFQIAENTSVLKQQLDLYDIPFQTPTPGQIKKNFAGKGNLKKEPMCEEFERRFGVKINEIINCGFAKSPHNDLVDSCAILLMHEEINERNTT